MEDIRIEVATGKDLLDSKITKFEVINGAWIGELSIRNNQPYLHCKDYNGEIVNAFPISNTTILNYIIKPLSQEPLFNKVHREKPRDLVEVIRCKDCGYYQGEEPNRYCMGLPTEPAVCREPDDFCSRGRRRKSDDKPKKDYPDFNSRHSDVFYERLVKWLRGEIEVYGQERLVYEVGLSMFDFKSRSEAIKYFSRYIDDEK